ncbi:MAG: DUF6084 family protein [Terriglobales bacterium]
MPELRFFIEGFEPAEHALAPALRMRLRTVNASPEPVHAIWLRLQLQIEPARRRYSPSEAATLLPLFAAPERWDQTLRPFLWQQAVAMVPGFTGTTVSEVLLPCTRDFSLAATQYCEALADGCVPVLAQFSGMAMMQGENGLTAAPIPWELEARYAMPVDAWRSAVRRLYGDSVWIPLHRDVFDQLLAFRTARGMASWEHTLEHLLDSAAAGKQEAA